MWQECWDAAVRELESQCAPTWEGEGTSTLHRNQGGIKLSDKIIKIDTLDVPRMMQDDAVKGSGGASSYCATELASALLVLLPSCFALILRTLEVTEFLTTPTGRVWFAGGGCG